MNHSNLYADLPGYINISPSVLTGDELRPDLLITLENKCIYILELNVGFELSPPQRLLKNMKFEGIEIALEGIWYEDNR